MKILTKLFLRILLWSILGITVLIVLSFVFPNYKIENPPSGWYMLPNDDCVDVGDMEPDKPQRFLEEYIP